MPLFYLSKEGLTELLGRLLDWGELYWVNAAKEGNPRLEKAVREEIVEYKLPTNRGVEPAKALVFPPKQLVATYPKGANKELDIKPEKRAIFGIAQCDLAGIAIFDRVFRDDPEFLDPFYIARRDGLFVVTHDCVDAKPSCFCNLVKGKPYPTEAFDLNLSALDDGYLVETGSARGEEMLRGTGASQATDALVRRRDENRAAVMRKLENQNAPFVTEKDFITLVTENQEEPATYTHHGATCVECGACTNVCPACFCFGLCDNVVGKGEFERHLTWDSCQFAGFSRMAGMLNPRARIAQRFMHRFNHKFFHYPWRYEGVPSCTGCGRCIENCMGRIDMRATLRDLSVTSKSEMFAAPSPAPSEDPRAR